MASIRIAGRWVADDDSWGELQWSSVWHGGSDQASWSMNSTKRLPYRPGQLVELVEKGFPVWAGTLLEPDGDTLHARGLHYQAQRTQSIWSGSATTVPNLAVSRGITAGLLTWRNYDSLSGDPFGTADGPVTVAGLLDNWAESLGKVWSVNGQRILKVLAPPTVPKWHVAPGAAQLQIAEDSYVTTLYGNYFNGTTTAQVSATNADSAKRHGAREEWIDLTGDNLALTAPQAQAIVDQRLAMGAARPGWANGLSLSQHELTTPGGSPANLRAVQGGDLIRINGQFDPTAFVGLPGYIDIIADEVTYVDGASTIDIKPVGLEARTLQDVLTLAIS